MTTRCAFNFPKAAIKVVTQPTEPLLTLTEAYAQLRLDPTFGTSPPSRPDDALIEGAVTAATAEVDGPEGWLGRCIAPQTLALSLPELPRDGAPIFLPFPPLIAVDSVTYLDADGVETQLVETADYRVGTEGRVPYIAPAWGTSFPRGRVQGGAVTIIYRCGYAAGSPPVLDRTNPQLALIRQYVAARLGFYYEHREDIIAGSIVATTPGYASILENVRIRGAFRE
jgi:uncharacterized phiE125 gp8 family phage protein